MSHYFKKQLTIGIVWLIIFVIIIGGIYLLVKPVQPTCTDKIQNQGEEQVDCGGPCLACLDSREPIEVLARAIIPTTNNFYDLVVKVKNPNSKWGVESLDYVFNFYDENNQLITTHQGKTYILPQEIKYIIDQRIVLNKIPTSIEFNLQNVSWIKLENFTELELRLKNPEHQTTESGFHKLVGAIENKTNYDLDTIEIVGILSDSNGEIVSVGKTEMNTIKMNETRGFEIIWPYLTPETVATYNIRVYTDVFSNDNFIRTQGDPERVKE